LVREFSLEGDLKALPRSRTCQVADADACWATSLRRSFLTMSFNPSGASTAQPTVRTDNNVPPKPADPPAEGMVRMLDPFGQVQLEMPLGFPLMPL